MAILYVIVVFIYLFNYSFNISPPSILYVQVSKLEKVSHTYMLV